MVENKAQISPNYQYKPLPPPPPQITHPCASHATTDPKYPPIPIPNYSNPIFPPQHNRPASEQRSFSKLSTIILAPNNANHNGQAPTSCQLNPISRESVNPAAKSEIVFSKPICPKLGTGKTYRVRSVERLCKLRTGRKVSRVQDV